MPGKRFRSLLLPAQDAVACNEAIMKTAAPTLYSSPHTLSILSFVRLRLLPSRHRERQRLSRACPESAKGLPRESDLHLCPGDCHGANSAPTSDTDPVTARPDVWAEAPPRGLAVTVFTCVVGDCFAPAKSASARNDEVRCYSISTVGLGVDARLGPDVPFAVGGGHWAIPPLLKWGYAIAVSTSLVDRTVQNSPSKLTRLTLWISSPEYRTPS